jgi:hypothetical protein
MRTILATLAAALLLAMNSPAQTAQAHPKPNKVKKHKAKKHRLF